MREENQSTAAKIIIQQSVTVRFVREFDREETIEPF
jgi:hypothetical protein